MFDFDPMLFLIVGFAAYLAALLAVVYTSKKPSELKTFYVSPQTLQSPTMQTPAKPKFYKHTLTVPNLIKAQSIVKQLEENNIKYTLTKSLGENLTLQFTTQQTLSNLEELKKKGVIADAKIEEVKEEEEDPADCSSFIYSPT